MSKSPEHIINIQPMTMRHEFLFSSIQIKLEKLILDDSATFHVRFPEQTIRLRPIEIVIQGQDYKNWLNDDSYVVQYIISKLNLVIRDPENISTESTGTVTYNYMIENIETSTYPIVSPEPEVVSPEPEVVSPDPEVVSPEPEVSPDPEVVVSPDPEVTP